MNFSIRYKFAIGFLFIFCMSFNCITMFINKIVIRNNEKVIQDEFLVSQRDIDIFFNQYIIINNIECSRENFKDYSEKIGYALNSKINDRIMLYSNDGNIIFDSDYNSGILYLNDGTPIKDDLSDLNISLKDQPVYKILNVNGVYKAVFSKPLYINNEMIGVLRYIKDYTELFQNGNDMVLNIKILLIVMFFILFIFSFILSTKIIIPIINLNKITREISDGNFEIPISIKSNDKIGQLSESFNIMREKVKEQIETIKRDRDDLIKSESHRKVFYDNVTHEIKTPLTIIDGYAQMILDEENSDQSIIFNAASKIKKESNKLINMIVDILNLSKLESKSNNDLKEKIELKNTIENICSHIGVKANKYGIRIEKTLEDNMYVYANRSDINSIIINIIDNSIKYSNVNSIIKINLFKNKEHCNMIFEDEGKGIDSESLKNIFEPFYRGSTTLENGRKGNGLGLSIVKSIVDKYGGNIKIESEINKGTKVFVQIPFFTNWQQLD